MRIPSLPLWGDAFLPGSFQNWYPCLEEMMHFWPYSCNDISRVIPSVSGWTPICLLWEGGTAGGTWHTSPFCRLFDCTDCKAEKPKAEGGRGLQQERKDLGKQLCLLSWLRVFSLQSYLFLMDTLMYLFCCELSCCCLLLTLTTTWLPAPVLTPLCFGFALDQSIILSEGC